MKFRLTRSGARSRVRVLTRGEHLAPLPADPLDLLGFHESGDLITANVMAGTLHGGLPELVGAIKPWNWLTTHNTISTCIISASRTALADGASCPALGGVVAARSDLQRTADRLDLPSSSR